MHDNSIDAFFYWALHLDVFDNFGHVSDKYVLKNTSYIALQTKLSSSPVENKPTRWLFLREPGEDIEQSAGSVTERCFWYITINTPGDKINTIF